MSVFELIVGSSPLPLAIGIVSIAFADVITKKKEKQKLIRQIGLILIGIGCIGVGVIFVVGGLK